MPKILLFPPPSVYIISKRATACCVVNDSSFWEQASKQQPTTQLQASLNPTLQPTVSWKVAAMSEPTNGRPRLPDRELTSTPKPRRGPGRASTPIQHSSRPTEYASPDIRRSQFRSTSATLSTNLSNQSSTGPSQTPLTDLAKLKPVVSIGETLEKELHAQKEIERELRR